MPQPPFLAWFGRSRSWQADEKTNTIVEVISQYMTFLSPSGAQPARRMPTGERRRAIRSQSGKTP
jgi:hypothetical protein